MNAFLLMMAVKTHLEAALRDMVMEAPPRHGRSPQEGQGSAARAPVVHVGALPPKTAECWQDAPFVVVQAMNGSGTDGTHVVDIALRVAVYGKDSEAAENFLHNLIARVRAALAPCTQQALHDSYVLVSSDKEEMLPWVRPDEQAPPYLEGYIMSRWQMMGFEN